MRKVLGYVKPQMEILVVEAHGVLDSLSMKVSDDPATGGGDAKNASFIEEDYQPFVYKDKQKLWDE